MKFKNKVIKIISTFILFFSQPSQANFSEALDAYISRDAERLIKEVQLAVKNNNCDGLMLFLIVTNIDYATSDFDSKTRKVKSTLKTILSKKQWDQLSHLLLIAAKNSSLDSQFFLLTKSQFKKKLKERQSLTEMFAKKGSLLAMYSSKDRLYRARAGNIEAQLHLAFNDLNSNNIFDCSKNKKNNSCSKSLNQRFFWLKNLIQASEVDNHHDFDLVPSKICSFLVDNSSQSDQEKLNQAFLWGQKGVNETGSFISESMNCLRSIYKSKNLDFFSSELFRFRGNEFNQMVYKPNLSNKPSLWNEVIEEQKYSENLPIFSYSFGLGLDLYKDGRVFLTLPTKEKAYFNKLSLEQVKEFFDKLKEVGFYEWTTLESYTGICPDFDSCETFKMNVTSRYQEKNKRISFKLLTKHAKNNPTLVNRERIRAIKKLVDDFFPIKQLICGIGNSSSYKKRCLENQVLESR